MGAQKKRESSLINAADRARPFCPQIATGKTLPFLLPPGASTWLTNLPAIWHHLAGAVRKPALAVAAISGRFSEACDLGSLVPLSGNRLMGALERMLLNEAGGTPDAGVAFEAAKLELLSLLGLLNGVAESGEGAKGFHFFGEEVVLRVQRARDGVGACSARGHWLLPPA